MARDEHAPHCYLRVGEVAVRLRRSAVQVRRLIRRGLIPAFRFGGEGPWLVPLDELEALEQELIARATERSTEAA